MNNNTIDVYFMYLNWRQNSNNRLKYVHDSTDTVKVLSTVGPYKNSFSEEVFAKGKIYTWQIKILKGSYFKIGILKQSEIDNPKMKAFSDNKNGYALMSTGKLRNGSNKDGIQLLKNGYGPGDIVNVQFNCEKGTLSFGVNNENLEKAFTVEDFKKGGYVAAVAALHEGSTFSLTLPDMED